MQASLHRIMKLLTLVSYHTLYEAILLQKQVFLSCLNATVDTRAKIAVKFNDAFDHNIMTLASK